MCELRCQFLQYFWIWISSKKARSGKSEDQIRERRFKKPLRRWWSKLLVIQKSIERKNKRNHGPDEIMWVYTYVVSSIFCNAVSTGFLSLSANSFWTANSTDSETLHRNPLWGVGGLLLAMSAHNYSPISRSHCSVSRARNRGSYIHTQLREFRQMQVLSSNPKFPYPTFLSTPLDQR